MYLRRLFLIAAFLLIGFNFSLSAYAAPEKEETFFTTFNINQEDLKKEVEGEELGLYQVSKNGSSTLLSADIDINDYKIFNLNKGYTRLSVVTFASSKVLSGKGEADTFIGVNVFYFDKEGAFISTDSSISQIGVSGVYNGNATLKIGDNNVIIAVKKGDTLFYRLFKVVVKQEETKGTLENIKINLIEKTNPTESKTDKGSILKSVLGNPIDNLIK